MKKGTVSRRWTPAEDSVIKSESARGTRRAEIGRMVDRTEDAVNQRALLLGCRSYIAPHKMDTCPGGHPLTPDPLGPWCTICLWVLEPKD